MDLTGLPFPEPIFATGIEIGLLAGGIILSAIAGLLLTPKLLRNPLSRKSTNPVLAERGAFIPYLIGTFRLGCVFAWAGKPRSATAVSGGVLGFGTTKTKISSQAGWHLICVGPADALIRIYEAGKIVYPIAGEAPIFKTNYASGSSLIKCKSGAGSFKLYWGDGVGVPDPILTDSVKGIDIASRFPNVCYIVWQFKHLQTVNQWPEMNYEVRVLPFSAYLSGVTLLSPYLTGTPWIGGLVHPGTNFSYNNGANPIHAIAEVMLNTYPQGIGIPVANLDLTFFNAMQAICTTEGVPSNVVSQDGNKASDFVNDILQDIGGIIPQVGDKIIIYLIRKETAVPVIPDDALLPPLPEKVFAQGNKIQDRITYVYKDRELAYRDNDITIDDDSDQQGRSKSVQTAMNSIIDLDIANKIVDRKQMENLVDVKTYKVTGGRQMRALSPGQVFSAASLGQLRIVAVSRPDLSSSIELECVQDTYSPVATGHAAIRELVLDVAGFVVPDAQLFMWIVPYDLMPVGSDLSDTWVQFFPIRGSDYTIQSNVYVSFDDGVAPVYNLAIESTGLFVQGILTQYLTPDFSTWDKNLPISSDGYQLEVNLYNFSTIDETGHANPTLLDFDIDTFPDLSAYPERWRNGENCCIIEDQMRVFREVIYFKSISVSPNPNCYYLNGVLRNRMIKSVPEYEVPVHLVDDLQLLPWSGSARVVLFRREDLNPVKFPNSATGALWSNDKTLHAKTNAVGVNGDVNLDEGNAFVAQRIYLSFKPIPPANFRSIDEDTNSKPDTWASGATCTFKWSNRPLLVGNGDTAGRQLAGVAISPTPVPFEGVLEIKIYDDSTNLNLKHFFTVTTGTAQAYTQAQRVIDGISGATSFYVTWQVNFNGIKGAMLGRTFNAR